MVSQLLFTISLACTSPQLDGTVLNTTHGKAAVAQFQALSPTDSANWFTLGVLYANRNFTLESEKKRRDADSALYYLRKAQTRCPDNPVIAAYIAVAIGLRVKEDNIFKQIWGDTKERGHNAFMVMDSLMRSNPENLAVQFLGACLLREASKHFADARDFLLTSNKAFTALHQKALEGCGEDFFSPDVRGHILLSLAILIRKLEDDPQATVTSREYIAVLLSTWPNTPAAEYAKKKKLLQK